MVHCSNLHSHWYYMLWIPVQAANLNPLLNQWHAAVSCAFEKKPKQNKKTFPSTCKYFQCSSFSGNNNSADSFLSWTAVKKKNVWLSFVFLSSGVQTNGLDFHRQPVPTTIANAHAQALLQQVPHHHPQSFTLASAAAFHFSPHLKSFADDGYGVATQRSRSF